MAAFISPASISKNELLPANSSETLPPHPKALRRNVELMKQSFTSHEMHSAWGKTNNKRR